MHPPPQLGPVKSIVQSQVQVPVLRVPPLSHFRAQTKNNRNDAIKDTPSELLVAKRNMQHSNWVTYKLRL